MSEADAITEIETFDFGAALERLRAGKFVCRQRWAGLRQLPRYLMLSRDETPRIIACWEGPPARVQAWKPWANDLLAGDWRQISVSEILG